MEHRILGMIYGQCLGDAVGLQTELAMKKDFEGKTIHPHDEPMQLWQSGDWVNDSDQMILLMDLIAQDNLNSINFAKSLKYWVNNGFAELDNNQGYGVGGEIMSMICSSEFIKFPQKVASEFWLNSGKTIAANESLMRTSIISTIPNEAQMLEKSKQICTTTHYDPRCWVCCKSFNYLLFWLLRGHCSATHLNNIVKFALTNFENSNINVQNAPNKWINRKYISNGQYNYLAEFKDYLKCTSLARLYLWKHPNVNYVYKCFGSALFAYKQLIATNYHPDQYPQVFKDIIMKIALERGNANTNCAVAGAVMGAYFGYTGLPAEWIKDLPYKKWLNVKIEKLFKFLAEQQPLHISISLSLRTKQIEQDMEYTIDGEKGSFYVRKIKSARN